MNLEWNERINKERKKETTNKSDKNLNLLTKIILEETER